MAPTPHIHLGAGDYLIQQDLDAFVAVSNITGILLAPLLLLVPQLGHFPLWF